MHGFESIAESPISSVPSTYQLLTAIAIASQENFGIARLNLRIKPGSVTSSEVFGGPSLVPGPAYIFPLSIASTNEFGSTILLFGQRIIIYQPGLKKISGVNVKTPAYINQQRVNPVYTTKKAFKPKYIPPC